MKSTKSGSISYTSVDISQCDNDVFFCEHYSCTGSWIFTEKTGSTYKFNEEFSSSSECANGFVELTFVGKDELRFSWVEDYFDPTTASGTLKRKN